MEYKLIRKTVTSSIYNVDNAFYLIVPKLIIDRNIEVVIEENVNLRIDEISNSSNITIARPFASDYFNNINDLVAKYKLKSLINTDVSLARQVLQKENIEYNNDVSLNTPYSDFKTWYQSDLDRQSVFNKIDVNAANPISSYKETNDDLIEIQKRKEELLSLKQELYSNKDVIEGEIKEDSGKGNGKQKIISNGKSTLKSFDDGFINIIFLCIVTLFVTVGTMLAMLYIMG